MIIPKKNYKIPNFVSRETINIYIKIFVSYKLGIMYFFLF